MDLFATSLNTKLPLYVSPIPDPQAWAVDELNIPWENLVAYVFSPTALLPKVVQKLQSQICKIILITLGWPTKPCFFSGDVSGHTKTITTHSHFAETTTEQPMQRQPSIPQSPCVVSKSSTLQEHNFTAEVAERIAAPQTLSTRVFQRWCTEEQVDFKNPSISDICNFFWYLFNVLNQCPSTIEGCRTAIAYTLGNTRLNISNNMDISRLIVRFYRDKPKSSRNIPNWNLLVVLHRLTQPPFEPQEEADLKFLTWKVVFLLALASGKRHSEIHAWTLHGLLCLGDWEQVQLVPSPSFFAKNQLVKDGWQLISPVVIPALKYNQDSQDTHILLCLVRALRCYLDRTSESRGVDNYCLSPLNWAILRILFVPLSRLGFQGLLRRDFNGSDYASLPLEITLHLYQVLSQGPSRTRPNRRLLPSGHLHHSIAGDASFQTNSRDNRRGSKKPGTV